MSAVDVSYLVTGNGPPVYMVHGIGSRKTTWAPLVAELKKRFTCVAYDLRGHGDSPVPSPPYTLEELVDDLEALRNRLGHEKIHIVGHSLGGMIGPAYARAFPDRVFSVSLLSTAAGRSDEDRDNLARVAIAMRERGVMPVISTLVERWYTDEFISNAPSRIEQRKAQVEATPEEVFLSVFDVYATTEMAPWLNSLTCPCLVMTGEGDLACSPRLNRFIAAEIPDSDLVILENLKHSILVEAPHRVIPHLKKFLYSVVYDRRERV